jgi:hypothetical protein
MWKYILIALFLLLAIRELNLMNQSLYVTLDNKIVAEDKTTASEFKKLINKLEHNEFLLSEPDAIVEKNTSSKDQTKEESSKSDKINPSTSTLSDIKLPEENQTSNMNKVLTSNINEKNLTKQKIHTTPITKKSNQSEKNSVKAKTTVAHIQKEKVAKLTEKTTLHEYPERFKSAQERVQAILREMKQH